MTLPRPNFISVQLYARMWVALLLVAHPLLLVGAVLPNKWVVLAALIACFVAENEMRGRAPGAQAVLNRVQLGVAPRWIARDGALLLFAVRAHLYSEPILITLILGVIVLHVARALFQGASTIIEIRRRLPTPTRNIDLSKLNIPDGPPEILVRATVARQMLPMLAWPAGVLVDAFSGSNVVALIGLAVAGVLLAVADLLLIAQLVKIRHLGNQRAVQRTIHQLVTDLKPEVALYYTGGPETTYQVNMWLETMAKLSMRPLVIVRERNHLTRVNASPVPLVCLPGNTDVMDFELPTLKVVLYTGNTGRNFNMLRDPDAKHVFIGHGDSDKIASANPVSKVYDEVWVAGPAGRDRYARAAVGVRDEAIVEVGRPQLHSITPAVSDRPMFTVLYAPTWEGWTNDALVSSLHVVGVQLISTLLELSPEIRVIYKPHPMTGIRNAQVKKAHQKIVKMIADANAKRAGEPRWAKVAAESEPATRAAKARIEELKAAAAGLLPNTSSDPATLSRDTGRTDPQVYAELDRLTAEREDAFWAASGWWRHRVVNDSHPTLYSCFNESDIMISDISSVVSDYVASGKPYVVTNLHDIPESQFRYEQTAAGGAYLLGSKCAELDTILAEVRKPGPDALAARRAASRTYLLGPAEPDAMTRFDEAVRDLARQRDLTVAARRAARDSSIPKQTTDSMLAGPEQADAVPATG